MDVRSAPHLVEHVAHGRQEEPGSDPLVRGPQGPVEEHLDRIRGFVTRPIDIEIGPVRAFHQKGDASLPMASLHHEGRVVLVPLRGDPPLGIRPPERLDEPPGVVGTRDCSRP